MKRRPVLNMLKKVLLKPCVNTAFGVDICITNTKIPFSAGRSNIRWPSTATKYLESSYWRSNQICHHHTLLSKERHNTFSCKIWYSIVQIIFLSGTTSRFSGGTWHLLTPSKQVQGLRNWTDRFSGFETSGRGLKSRIDELFLFSNHVISKGKSYPFNTLLKISFDIFAGWSIRFW